MSDDYETQYMAKSGEVIHRDKLVWRLGLPLLGTLSIVEFAFAAGALLLGVTGGAPSEVMIPTSVALAAGGGLLGFCAATLTVLRTVVTTREVNVQYGLWGPTIALEAIESVEVDDYPMMRFGGWGIRVRFGTNERAYSIADQKRAVCIRYTKDGKTHVVWLSAQDPDVLADAIQRARASVGSPYRARVASAAEEEEELEVSEAGEHKARSR